MAEGTRLMRLLFSVGSFGFLRNFESALRLLAERGHYIQVIADRKDRVGGSRIVEALERDYAGRVTWAYAAFRRPTGRQAFAVALRAALDSWRYLDARYDHSPTLRARGERQAPRVAAWLAKVPLVGRPAAMHVGRPVVRWLERRMAPTEAAERFLREHQPDLLLVTPLLYFRSLQVEYVRAARKLGIRSALGVGSWDHLTSKGLIHEVPDAVIVWNEMQRREAAELHGVDPARVIVTGAQAYDGWFVQQPSVSRAEFCGKIGLPDGLPLLLYLCSSPFIAPHEVGFVRRWIAAIRASADPELRRAAILIRPHPQNAGQWTEFAPSDFEAVALWPRAGANPIDTEARADYFDSMHYSTAVVGVNTSALIESGIVGRPIFSVIDADFSTQQEGTLHFQHLKDVNGGLVSVARTLEEHVSQLSRALRGDYDAARGRAFVAAFVRPHGLATPAAERFADAVEADRRLKILFTMASPEYLRYFDSTMRLLADRGHAVAVAVNSLRERKHARLALIDDPRIAIAGVVPARGDVWMALARAARGTMDYLRYLEPRFADAPALRNRMYRKVLPTLLRPLDRIPTLRASTVSRLIRLLQAVERAVPVSRNVLRFLKAQAPDIVVASPLVDAASDQVDTVRAARAAGIPVIAGIASWDNLTNKGLLRVEPDLVTVWNGIQKTEAVELHGMPPERVVVTGAQLFDRWFDRTASMTRAEFCRLAGLPDDRPFVLFTGSSVFIARSEHEVPFVRRWVAALRAAADPLLRDVAVLVRPHPFNPEAWMTADFADLAPVAIWPRMRYTPASEDARTSLFDSLYHCQAVVGINTSAMIEAAILGKPVLSILSPEFAGTQDGTIHFRYLRSENGGCVRVAGSTEEHLGQLAAVLRDPALVRDETERFVRSFVRPHGLATPCTPILAETIERAGQRRSERRRAGASAVLLRVPLWPAAVAMWIWTILKRAWTIAPDPAAGAADAPRTVFEKGGRVVRVALHRGRRYGSRLLTRTAGGMRRVPRRLVRHVRLARYYLATVVLQRAARDGDPPVRRPGKHDRML